MLNKKDVRVLYVEDDEGFYSTWLEWFREVYSERSDHVRSKAEAEDLVLECLEDYHIALVDLGILHSADSKQSEERYGKELIESISGRVPCVMCSGSITPEIRRQSQAVGFLGKPFTESEMAEVIARVLGGGEDQEEGRL